MTYPKNMSLIKTLNGLSQINGEKSATAQAKILKQLESHAINFIERSPFCVIATGQTGSCDASPRGDEPGFVKVLDDTTILLPERPGNRLADSMSNIIVSPAVGLIFMIPGMNETLRVNGDAYLTDQSDLLEQLAHRGKPPKLGIIVDIKEIYFHCAKAFIRSKLWHEDAKMSRDEMPTLGKILLDQIKGKGVTEQEVAQIDVALNLDAEQNLYHQ